MNLQGCEEVSVTSASGGGGEKQDAQVVQSKPDERSMPRPSFLTEDVVRGVRNVSDLGVPEDGAKEVHCQSLRVHVRDWKLRLTSCRIAWRQPLRSSADCYSNRVESEGSPENVGRVENAESDEERSWNGKRAKISIFLTPNLLLSKTETYRADLRLKENVSKGRRSKGQSGG